MHSLCCAAGAQSQRATTPTGHNPHPPHTTWRRFRPTSNFRFLCGSTSLPLRLPWSSSEAKKVQILFLFPSEFLLLPQHSLTEQFRGSAASGLMVRGGPQGGPSGGGARRGSELGKVAGSWGRWLGGRSRKFVLQTYTQTGYYWKWQMQLRGLEKMLNS